MDDLRYKITSDNSRVEQIVYGQVYVTNCLLKGNNKTKRLNKRMVCTDSPRWYNYYNLLGGERLYNENFLSPRMEVIETSNF